MKKILLADCEVGKEYVSIFGKIIQVVSNSPNSGFTKILVLCIVTEVDVLHEDNYEVYEFDEEDERTYRRSNFMVENPPATAKFIDTEDKVDETHKKLLNKGNKLKKNKPKKAEQMTSKQLVKEILQKKSTCTRTDLAKAIVDAGLTDHGSVKKAKSYISIILHKLRNKEGWEIQDVSPGVYKLVSVAK